MALDIQSHAAETLGREAETEHELQWVETALLAGGVGIGVVLVSMLSVLLHLS